VRNEPRENLGSARKTHSGHAVAGQQEQTVQGWDWRELGSP
jgi:hypothetical protein